MYENSQEPSMDRLHCWCTRRNFSDLTLRLADRFILDLTKFFIGYRNCKLIVCVVFIYACHSKTTARKFNKNFSIRKWDMGFDLYRYSHPIFWQYDFIGLRSSNCRGCFCWRVGCNGMEMAQSAAYCDLTTASDNSIFLLRSLGLAKTRESSVMIKGDYYLLHH